MKKSLLTASFLTLSSLSFAGSAHNLENMYVFGDSLSDQGNLAAILNAQGIPLQMGNIFLHPLAPYADGRFSNGPTGVEVLAGKLGFTLTPSYYFSGQEAGNNYAVAGARASTDQGIDMSTQINAYLGLHGLQADAETLYVVMFGGNDIRIAYKTDIELATGIDLVEPKDEVFAADGARLSGEEIIQKAITNIKANIEKLIGAGAENVFVVGAPDISKLPETDFAAALFGEYSYQASEELSASYNDSLRSAVRELKHKHRGVQFAYFNLDGLFQDILENSEELGFVNKEEACWYTYGNGSTIAPLTQNPACEDRDSFVFFDDIHPSAPVHAIAGEKLYKKAKAKFKKKGKHSKSHGKKHK